MSSVSHIVSKKMLVITSEVRNAQPPLLAKRPASTHLLRRRTPTTMRLSASPISLSDARRSDMGNQVRSISTDSRGKSLQKRLMAVPPFERERGLLSDVW